MNMRDQIICLDCASAASAILDVGYTLGQLACPMIIRDILMETEKEPPFLLTLEGMAILSE